MASALALGHAGLRLRSRRVRSGRSHRLSIWFVLAVAAIATVIAIESATMRGRSEAVDAAGVDRQAFVVGLQPIHAEVQQSVGELGLVVVSYQSAEIDRPELQRRLAKVLAGYSVAMNQLQSLQPGPGLEFVQQDYRSALDALASSAAELSRAYDDGDQARVTAALAHSLEATARLHSLADLTLPVRD